ncbi:MAG TPA: AMP-binding protein [Candidatus Binatia bacterium]
MSVPNTPLGSSSRTRHIGQIFFQRVRELGDRTFVKLQKGTGSVEISWRDFGAMVQNILLALYSLGLTPGDTVAIIGENSLERLCADLATLAGGFPNVVISPALSDSMFFRVLDHAKCCAAFIQSETDVDRLLGLKGQLPTLAHLFVMKENTATLPGALSFQELVESGRRVNAERLEDILESVQGNDLATIMYTSGSTGEPKGVMRTQDNLLSNITNGGEITVSKPDDLFVIVLSLNHLLGRFGFLKSAVTGRATAIIEATELDLDLKVIEALSGTAMALVPRVMERIWKAILDQDDHRKRWEMLEALDQQKARGALGESDSKKFDELRNILKEATRKTLGGRIKYISYSGAAMPPRIMRFFELIGIPLLGSYGSTECGGVTLCGIGENRPGNLGKPFPNVEVSIASDSEILVRGPTVSPGYFLNPEATREVLDTDGWFHTGDLGALDADGSLRIIGRKKDVFYCADGSNIYPAFIELQLENEPFVRQAVLLGDRRPFIAALIVPDRQRIGEHLELASSILTDSEVRTALWTRIEIINERLEHYEQIRKFVVMRDDFPAAARSINIFQKVKIDRKAVAERYQAEIDEIYSSLAQEDKS